MSAPARPLGCSTTPPSDGEVLYPESDGAPLGETEAHGWAIVDIVLQMRWHHHDREADVHFAFDQFWYFVEGDPRAVICPDAYAAFGVPQLPMKPIWKTWEDHAVPTVAFEVTSESTRRNDLGRKRHTYEQLGTEELWLFDPYEEWIEGQVLGFVRGPTGFREVPSVDGRWWSARLGLWLAPRGTRLVLVTPEGDEAPAAWDLRRGHEALLREAAAARGRAEAEHERAEAEHERAEAAEARAERLARRLRELGVDED